MASFYLVPVLDVEYLKQTDLYAELFLAAPQNAQQGWTITSAVGLKGSRNFKAPAIEEDGLSVSIYGHRAVVITVSDDRNRRYHRLAILDQNGLWRILKPNDRNRWTLSVGFQDAIGISQPTAVLTIEREEKRVRRQGNNLDAFRRFLDAEVELEADPEKARSLEGGEWHRFYTTDKFLKLGEDENAEEEDIVESVVINGGSSPVIPFLVCFLVVLLIIVFLNSNR